MNTDKKTRQEIINLLVARDGDHCKYPSCGRKLNFKLVSNPREVTIDHIEPQAWCKEQGWTQDEIWDLSNLQLLCKACNAQKGDRRYLPDGTLPPKSQSTFRLRREKRAERPSMCDTCYSGRILLVGEECPACGSGPQPSFPTAYQMRADECPHEGPWSCYSCIVGLVQRKPAYIDVFDIENSGIE